MQIATATRLLDVLQDDGFPEAMNRAALKATSIAFKPPLRLAPGSEVVFLFGLAQDSDEYIPYNKHQYAYQQHSLTHGVSVALTEEEHYVLARNPSEPRPTTTDGIGAPGKTNRVSTDIQAELADMR